MPDIYLVKGSFVKIVPCMEYFIAAYMFHQSCLLTSEHSLIRLPVV